MRKIISAVLATAVMAVSLFGCSNGGTGSSAGSDASGTDASKISGQIHISGSSALQPLVQAAADNFREKNPDVSITVNAGGSGTGLQNVTDKTVDVGNSDVFAEEKLTADKASALKDHIVCVVGVAAVVNSKVGVTNLTRQQLIDIFTGKTANWKAVGGQDQKIVIMNRPASSGTRSLFKQYALDGKDEATGKALTEDNSGTIKQNVAQTKGAIAYLAFSYLTDNSVTALSIDGVKPNYENVYSGKYGVWGYEHMYTNGEATGAAKSFIDYIESADFEKTVTEKGYGIAKKMAVKRDAPATKTSSSK